MEAVEVTGYDLYDAFFSGFTEVQKQRQMLNKINVFPVPDGDTGSNLLSTLASILDETEASHSFKETLSAMADAALNGARGNSGIIFAQYINGINHEIKSSEIVNMETLVEAIRRAVPYAYNAIMNPIEGTMITVIRDWSEAMYEFKNTVLTFEDFALHSLEVAKKSLANTPNLLDVLKKASVVDSGACGFVTFLEGIVLFIKTKHLQGNRRISRKREVAFEEEHLFFTDEIHYQYCTEGLISNLQVDMDTLKGHLLPFGDSLIVAGTREKCRIHVHTNKPAELFRTLRAESTILQQKVDDMRQQYWAANKRRHPIAIVTDSIADLPQSLIEEHQIHVLPLNLLIEGSPYLDKLTITPEDFYSLLDQVKEYPTSSLPTQKSVENLFSLLSTHYDAVIAITVSKAMSGTFQCVEKAAEKFIKEGYKIKVIDSKLNSGAQGLLVLDAAKMLDQGLGFEQVVDCIERQIEKTKIYVSIKTLKYMVRGGRISQMKGLVGKILNVKPIISIDKDGKGIAFGKAFTSKANLNKIVKIVEGAHREKGIKSFSVVHAHSEAQAKVLGAELTQILGMSPEYITEISTIVGLNAGVGAIAVSFMQE